MDNGFYLYHIYESASMRDVEDSLFLSVLATEGLHGRSQVNLDAVFYLDKKKRSCAVDATSQVGRDLARIFTGFLMNEIGEDAFEIEQVNGNESQASLRNGGLRDDTSKL